WLTLAPVSAVTTNRRKETKDSFMATRIKVCSPKLITWARNKNRIPENPVSGFCRRSFYEICLIGTIDGTGTVYFFLNVFRVSLVLDDAGTLNGGIQFVGDVQFAISRAAHFCLRRFGPAGKAVDAAG